MLNLGVPNNNFENKNNIYEISQNKIILILKIYSIKLLENLNL